MASKIMLYGFLLLAVLASLSFTDAQMQVCEPLDMGPFLGTRPTLNFMVDEATAEDIQTSELTDSRKYHTELRVYGNYEAGEFTLTRSLDFRFVDPFDYFKPVTMGNQNFLKLVRPLDRDGMTSARDDDVTFVPFTLTCTPTNQTIPKVVYDARLFINDVNDNVPVLQAVNVTVTEATPVGTVIFTAQAVDKDSNINGNITYSLLDHTDQFSIDLLTGEVTLTSELDYELMGAEKFIDISLHVEDGGPAPTHTATSTSRIYVTDWDDQGPAFVYPGCFTHMGVCAWPKYTTGLRMKKNQPIQVFPVPNKISAHVMIKAKDLDTDIANQIHFSIASTIPPGHEHEFRVDTTRTLDNEYVASVNSLTDMMVHEGFEIFLKAEEISPAKRHVIAMIYFMAQDPNKAKAEGQGSDGARPVDDDDDYTDQEVALIVVVAILASLLLCTLVALACVWGRRSGSGGKSADIAMGTSNGGFNSRM